MNDHFNLQRLIDAQDAAFDTALAELRAGAKVSHWMWFVFPQLRSLGHSSTAQHYGITSINEARAFVAHPLLGPRLRQWVEPLLEWAGKRSAEQILGRVDALKLRSSLTLFDAVEPGGLFARGLAAFCESEPDKRTLALLNAAA